MTTVYLHIGTVKTGTSAIQSFLVHNAELLEKKGYCLPALNFGFGTPFAHRNGHFLVHRPHRETEEEKRAEYQEAQDRAFAILEEKAKQFENIILTDEEIWQYCSSIENFWQILRDRFRSIHCEVKIIVYLRRQDLLVESLWNQWVKSFYKSTKSFSQWMRDKKYLYYPLDYHSRLEQIAGYMGKEHIILRIYEKEAFLGKENSIFSDFLQTVGLSLTEEYDVENTSSNNGLRGNFIEIKRLINGMPEYRDMEDFLRRPILYASNYADSVDPAPNTTMFTREDRLAFMKQFEESNRKVAEEYLGRKNGILFSEEIEDLPLWKWNEERVSRDLLMIMGEAFCTQEQTLIRQRDSIRKLEQSLRAMRNKVNAQQDKIGSLETDVAFMSESSIFRAYRRIRRAIRGK